MKIGVISKWDIDDVNAWSGTVSNLTRIISRKYEIVPVTVKDSVLKRLVRKLIYIGFGKKRKRTGATAFFDRAALSVAVNRAIGGGVRYFLRLQAAN